MYGSCGNMRLLMAPHDPAELEGTVSRIVYSNPENHWTVLRISAADPLGHGDETEIAVVAKTAA